MKYNLPEGSCSPHLKFFTKQDVRKHIRDYRQIRLGLLSFIDMGGRYGENQYYADGFDYKILEIDKAAVEISSKIIGEENVILGDACNCPQIQDNSFDVCFSNDVFEHLKMPWLAAKECVRITKKGGLLIHQTLFSWRYHPVPVDFYRYTHEGLAFLFEEGGLVKRVISGYDISMRRKDHRGGKIKGGLDVPPIDKFGGWREHWRTIYIGRKL